MKRLGSIVLLGGALVLAACSEQLRQGRCNQTSDCAAMAAYASYVCNLDPTSQGNGRCVPACQGPGDCEGGRICDVDSHGQGRCLFPTSTDGGGDADGGMNDGGDAGDAPHCPVCSGTTPVCVGVKCVECVTSSDCNSDPTKPICNTSTNACVGCASDDECVAKLGADPGICMFHQDGHCATDAETIYVEPKTGTDCRNVLQADSDGTAALPLCSIDLARRILASDSAIAQPRIVVRVRGTMNAPAGTFTRPAGRPEVSIVGQQGAFVAGGAQPSFDLRNGLFYLRAVKVSSSGSIGINAAPSSSDALTLRLDHVTVDNCQSGGILLDGAAFDIRNTTVTRSGPAALGPITGGGILINNVLTAGPKQITLSTVQMNNGGGISCSAGIDGGDDVLVSDNVNTAFQITPACNFSSCAAASATCGAQ
jgi:hypothetical protein